MKYRYLTLIIIVFASCQSQEISPIEIIKLEQSKIDEISGFENNDSTYIEYPRRADFWSIEYYTIEPNLKNAIFKDSIGNVVGYWKRIDGKNYESAECYPNGQLKGKLNYSVPGVFDGEAKYYYEDGRVRSIGKWKGYDQIGTWKDYNEHGELVRIKKFNNKGELQSEKEIKTNH